MAGASFKIYEPCVTYLPDGCTIEQNFYEDGTRKNTYYRNSSENFHRTDGAAIIYRNENGRITGETWYNHGKQFRVGGPTHTNWDDDGNKIKEVWCSQYGKHRIDAPAVMRWNNDGILTEEEWCINDLKHRIGGAAVIKRFDDVGIYQEEFWINGIRHRDYGPAYIKFPHMWSTNRKVILNPSLNVLENWFNNGEDVTEHINEMISVYKLPHWSKWSDNDKFLIKMSL